MQPGAPLSCWSCGTVVSAYGGRCPSCGAQQPDAPLSAPRPPLVDAREPSGGRKRFLSLVVLVTGLAIISALAFLLAPAAAPEAATFSSAAPPTAASPAASAEDEPRSVDSARIEPMVQLARAKARATTWNRDAALVSIHAEPVVNGLVDTTASGYIEYVFGIPDARDLGAVARVGSDTLVIRIDDSGMKSRAARRPPTSAALDPACLFDEAVRAIVASGVPADAPLVVDLHVSARHEKAVWQARSLGPGGLTRALDSQSCAILVR